MEHTAIFTGGGSAGHVTPNLALMRTLKREGWNIHYIGTKNGMEKDLVEAESDIPYHSISAGKLRRYFSMKNIADAFRVLRGAGQARRIIKCVKPDVLFSKGGYVSVPVVLAARKRCRIVVHESDYTPGLSNRIANRYADTICATFEDTMPHLGKKGVLTGTPIRPVLYTGDATRGLQFAGFGPDKPVLLAMGGSQGAAAINDTLREALPQLLQQFQIIHLCGSGKRSDTPALPGYVQYEYIADEMPDVLAAADIVLSRAGANAIFEFLALKKPALLIPLPLSSSRGDQIQNARYFLKKGYADVLMQEDVTPQSLTDSLRKLYAGRAKYMQAMQSAGNVDGTNAVLDIIRTSVE